MNVNNALDYIKNDYFSSLHTEKKNASLLIENILTYVHDNVKDEQEKSTMIAQFFDGIFDLKANEALKIVASEMEIVDIHALRAESIFGKSFVDTLADNGLTIVNTSFPYMYEETDTSMIIGIASDDNSTVDIPLVSKNKSLYEEMYKDSYSNETEHIREFLDTLHDIVVNDNIENDALANKLSAFYDAMSNQIKDTKKVDKDYANTER